MKTYWEDSDELWFNGGQYVIEDDEGNEICLLPIHTHPDEDPALFIQEKESTKKLAEKIVKALGDINARSH